MSTQAQAPATGKYTGTTLELAGVSKSFGGLHVLKSVSFQVPASTIHGIAGPNGAGKTTLLNIITGFDDADGGRCTVGDQDATNKGALAISRFGVARTFQGIRLFRGLTVRQQVDTGSYKHRGASVLSSMLRLPADRQDQQRTRAVTDQMLDFVGLAHVADRLAETLSYGDQRRLEIARALATQPAMLLLDEPTAGMNQADWTPVGELLSRLRQAGLTIIVVEHNMQLIEQFCDRVVVLAAGAVIAEDTPVKCLREPVVRRAYFGR